MAAPWEKYQSAPSEGPWTKFKSAPEAMPQDEERGLLQDTEFPGKGLVQGTVNALPTAGMMVGGLIGSAAGPIGAVGGAGLGTGAGIASKNALNRYLFGEKQDRSQIYGEPAKGIIEGAGAEAGGQVLGKGLELAANTQAGQKAGEYLSKGASKVGELITKVPKQEIQTYAQNADEIAQMAKSSDNSLHEAANQMREKFTSNIDQTRKQMNDQISSALKSSDKVVDGSKVIKALEETKSGIDQDLYPEQLGQIDSLINKVKKISDSEGNIPVQRAHALKQFLQEEASNAYRNPGQGTIGTKAANSAKSGAAVARQLVNEAEPAVATANSKLSNLHDIEDNLNMNLITEGKPEAGLLAAGTGGNERYVKSLKDLGEATGTDMIGDARKLAAMRALGSPGISGFKGVGKAGAGALLGGAAGYEAGGYKGAAVGAALGGALTSPMALKAAIDSGLTVKEFLRTPTGRQLLSKGLLNAK